LLSSALSRLFAGKDKPSSDKEKSDPGQPLETDRDWRGASPPESVNEQRDNHLTKDDRCQAGRDPNSRERISSACDDCDA